MIGFVIIKIRHHKIVRYKAESCATEIGLAAFNRNDDVLNALQLENSLNEKNVGSIDLTKQFIDQVKSRLSMLSAKEVLKNPRSKDLKKITILTLFYLTKKNKNSNIKYAKRSFLLHKKKLSKKI